MRWNKHAIRAARRINLVTALKKQGHVLRPLEQGNFSVDNLAGIIIKDNFWYDKMSKKGGNTIDFFVTFQHKSFSDTMTLLARYHKLP